MQMENEDPDEPPPEAGVEVHHSHVPDSDILGVAKTGVVDSSIDSNEGALDDDNNEPEITEG